MTLVIVGVKPRKVLVNIKNIKISKSPLSTLNIVKLFDKIRK